MATVHLGREPEQDCRVALLAAGQAGDPIVAVEDKVLVRRMGPSPVAQAGRAEGQTQRRPVEQVGREEPDVARPDLRFHTEVAEAGYRRPHDRRIR